MGAERQADPLEGGSRSGTASSAVWNAAAPSRVTETSSSCFDSVSEYREPFCTPIASARSAIEVPW